MIRSLNPSNMGMAMKCGEQFRRRYMLGERIPPAVAAGRGRGVHSASDVNFKQKMITGVDLPVDDLTDAARDGFVNSFRDGVFLTKKETSSKAAILNQGLNDTVRLTRSYRKEVAPNIQPEDSEGYIKADVGLDLPLAGRLDFIQTGRIDDIKTAGMSWPYDRAWKQIQVPVYSILYEKKLGVRPFFTYHVLVCLKNSEKYQRFDLKPVSNRNIASTLAVAKRLMHMVNAGVFMPSDRGAWWCSEKWCGYYLTCEYVGNGRALKWI